MQNDVWLVIAAYNESQVIGSTIRRASEIFQNIVVVDDCSLDQTSSIAMAAGALVCSHPINLGQGAALQTGIDFALSEGAEVIVTFDADGQHRPVDAAGMVARLMESGCDIILGSRFMGATIGMPPLRAIMIKAATVFTRVTTGLSISDTHNGLRALTGGAARKIRFRQNRMAHASEILSQISMLGLSYEEFPVTIIYSEYSISKGQSMSNIFGIMYDIILQKLYR